jgi:thiol-disulfide isomerase/thioredoxin
MIKIHIMLTRLIVLTGLVMVTSHIVAQPKPFTLNGNIQGKTGPYIYMSYADGQSNTRITDSSRVENGHFSFKGKLNGTTQVIMFTDRQSRSFDNYLELFLVPGDMKLSLDNNNFRSGAVLQGSPVQLEADALSKAKEPVMVQLKPLSAAYEKEGNVYREAIKAKKDEATLESLKEAANKAKDDLDPYYEQMAKIDREFMDRYPASYVTASMLRYKISSMSLQEGIERYSKLPDEIKSSGLGKEIKKELDGLQMGSPGATAWVFASKELRGTPLNLADYKGKYVLLDFWASWCVPCRKSNPHLLSQYSKYKDKGLEIIGISDDDSNTEAWRKAVEKDGIGVWKHVLRGLDMKKRLAGEKNESDISQYYGIHSLPTKILIDPNGIIIGRYGGGGENDEAMDKKFTEVFGD